MMTGKPKTLKKNNRKIVLNLIRTSCRISIAEISRTVDISKTTVMKIIDHLLEKGLIVSAGKGNSTEEGGKRPETFEFNKRAGYVIGVHLFSNRLFFVLSDLDSNIIRQSSVLLKKNSKVEKIVDLIAGSSEELLKEEDVDKALVIGMGVGLPGITDTDRGIVITSPRFPSWGADVNFRDLLIKKIPFQVPVVVENEFRFQAFAEKIKGVALNKKNIIAIGGGHGLAAGIIADGSIQRGVHYLAGEIGHMILNPADDELCACGGRGCFEVMVSAERLHKLSREKSGEFPDSVLTDGISSRKLRVGHIFDAANEGDKLACHIMDDVIRWFATGLSNMIVMYDPEIIIINGIYKDAGDYFLDNLRKRINDISLVRISKDADIKYSRFGDESTVTGAVAFIVDEYFNDLDV